MSKNEFGKIFIGSGKEMESVQSRTWKVPAVIGIFLVISYLIYESLKVGYRYAVDMVMYADYPLEIGFISVIRVYFSVALGILIMVIVGCSAFAFTKGNFRGNGVKTFVIMGLVILVLIALIAVLRFMVDVLLLSCSPDPLNAWFMRYYFGVEILIEWKIFPDMILNVLVIIGCILVIITMGSYGLVLKRAESVLDSEKPFKMEVIKGGGKRYDARCKVDGGIKVCELR